LPSPKLAPRLTAGFLRFPSYPLNKYFGRRGAIFITTFCAGVGCIWVRRALRTCGRPSPLSLTSSRRFRSGCRRQLVVAPLYLSPVPRNRNRPQECDCPRFCRRNRPGPDSRLPRHAVADLDRFRCVLLLFLSCLYIQRGLEEENGGVQAPPLPRFRATARLTFLPASRHLPRHRLVAHFPEGSRQAWHYWLELAPHAWVVR